MELEVQTRQIDLDPASRDLIETRAARLSERYPEMLRLHVTLRHGTHHRAGYEEAKLLANLEGTTLFAAKRGARATVALHAAFEALGIALARHHRLRRRHGRGAPQPSIIHPA